MSIALAMTLHLPQNTASVSYTHLDVYKRQDILNNFKRLGVAARTLDGKERLSQLHAVFHMDEQLPFQFEWDWLAPSGLSTNCLLYTSRCV